MDGSLPSGGATIQSTGPINVGTDATGFIHNCSDVKTPYKFQSTSSVVSLIPAVNVITEHGVLMVSTAPLVPPNVSMIDRMTDVGTMNRTVSQPT